MRETLLIALLLAAPEAPAASPLARLADALAAQIGAAAGSRPVELAGFEDRTGHGGLLGLDLRELVATRLARVGTPSQAGPRLRVQGVLVQDGSRLAASARVTEQPGGRLLDVVSASVEADAGLLALATGAAPEARTLDVVSSATTPAFDGPVLALVLVDPDRLLALFPGAVALYRLEASGFRELSRQALEGPALPVRAPGGLVAGTAGESSFWVLSSCAPRAALFAVENDRLRLRARADALPWPGSASGLRFRPGTNLIEGAPGGVPLLGLLSDADPVGVDASGRLVGPGQPEAELRVGPALARIFPGLIAASSAAPPAAADMLWLVESPAAGAARVVDQIPVEGAVRALAAWRGGETTRLVAALEPEPGRARLRAFELRRRP